MDDPKPKTQEEINDEKHPATEYHKKTFSFSEQELKNLEPLENAVSVVNAFIVLGQLAQQAKDNYVSQQVLQRIGAKRSADTEFAYNISERKIIVYEPRIWCVSCDSKKAEYKYEGKAYCSECLETVKKTLAEPIKEEKQPDKQS